jgi:hypothetical protein
MRIGKSLACAKLLLGHGQLRPRAKFLAGPGGRRRNLELQPEAQEGLKYNL